MTNEESQDYSSATQIAYWVVIAMLLYSAVRKFFWFQEHKGITLANSIIAIVSLAIGIWIARACLRGSRWAGAIMCGLAVLYLAGIASYLSAVHMFGNPYIAPIDLISGAVSSVAWFTLGFITLRRTKAAFLAGKKKSDN